MEEATIQDVLDKVEKDWGENPPEDMTEREHSMWSDIALLAGIIEGLELARRMDDDSKPEVTPLKKIEAMAACGVCIKEGEDLRCFPINCLRLQDGEPVCDQCFKSIDGKHFHELPPVTLHDLSGPRKFDIDSASADPEEYPQDGDPYLPKWAVTAFFQHKDEAEAFIKDVTEGTNDANL